MIGDAEILTLEEFTYTAQDRLLTHTHQVNNNAKQLLTKNVYNELGQVITKSVGGTDITGNTSLQKVDYKYNIRGWLKGINNFDSFAQSNPENDLFAFKINYQDNETNANNMDTGEIAVPQTFNGNVSETFWITGSDNIKRKYGYEYDNLYRLLNSNFQKFGAQRMNSYDERLTYDKNGNIKTIIRNGANLSAFDPAIDNLDYVYDETTKNSNRLLKVTDSEPNDNGFKDANKIGDDYTYDANGNMTSDKNKGITGIIYNHLNLPVKIDFGTNKIEYLYTATGQRMQKKVTDGSWIIINEYLNGFQYIKPKLGTLRLFFFPHAEGHVNQYGGNYTYTFNYTDHVGNIRLTYKDSNLNGIIETANNEITDENHYYPFGLQHEGYTVTTFQNYKYKYNGKEFQEDLGLNVYDYGFRNYDPAIGRWMNMDPLAKERNWLSPYNYVQNSPVNRTDPTGMLDGEYERDADGNWQKTSNIGDSIGIDFYHTQQKDKEGNQLTHVTDRKGNWNTIKNGKETLANSVIRSRNVDWQNIYNEWKSGTGPEKSVFEGTHSANIAIHDNYLFRNVEDKFTESGKKKGAYEANFTYGFDNYFTYNNMQVQMMGSYNASFYKLGDTVLNIIQDSKSRSSFYYHLPVDNYPRGSLEYNFTTKSFHLNNTETNTYQTYIFLTTRN